MEDLQSYTAFTGHKLLAQGRLEEVVLAVKKKLKTDPASSVLVFSDSTGKEMDFNLQGSDKEVLQRIQIFISPAGGQPAPSGPGRPKLGVLSREVSLLPRHWEWLSTQSGGASAAIRRLVEEARKSSSGKDSIKKAQERTYKFVSSIAGDLPRYEEALRALYAKDKKKFREQTGDWPTDIREHSWKMAAPVFA